MKLKYVTDKKRHLICVPYSKENLHQMAQELSIKKCWFHKNHYDIPKKRITEIEKLCIIVSSREIVEIIQSPKYGDIIISDEITGTAVPRDTFLLTQLQYNGNK